MPAITNDAGSRPAVVRQETKTFQASSGLFWERARRAKGCHSMEDIAMLAFYLPIIIFEAILESQANRRDSDARTDKERPPQ
jgi:hypothetical protein